MDVEFHQESFEQLLPPDFEYHVEKFTVCSDNCLHFDATIHLKCSTEKEITTWQKEFEQASETNWIVYRPNSHPVRSQFNRSLICHHRGKVFHYAAMVVERF
jgi:hypothetical protein